MRVLLLLLATTLATACHNQTTSKAAPSTEGGFYVEPASLSDARAARLLPTTGSENARHLLQYAPPLAAAELADSATSYYANERFDWILPVLPTRPVSRRQVQASYGREWLAQHGEPVIYGRSAATSRWTYAVAGSTDTVFTALALGWKLYEVRTEAPHSFTTAELASFEQATRTQATQLPGRLGLPNYSVSQAAGRSRALGEFVAATNQPVTIVLRADSAFRGRVIWDVMLSLGLHWGDGDLFHWDNPVPGAGDDFLFDVSTSTAPGYFLPEHIAAGEVATADLVFTFLIPRSAAPTQVLASMHRAASYCQRRLGGQLLDETGHAFNLTAATQHCRAVESTLRRQGLRPGMGDALYLF